MIEYKDEIITHVDCFFDLKDRIRILFRGLASIRVKTKTENLPGEVLSKSSVSVPHIFRFRKGGGVCEAKFNQSFKTDGKKDAAA